MSAPLRPSFWEELRRRRVVRAITVYAVVAWVAVQVADVFFPALRMPEWTVTLVAVLALLGFPVTVALAWIFDRTPQGLRRTESTSGETLEPAGEAGGGTPEASGHGGGRLALALGLGALLGVAVVGTGVWLAGVVGGSGPGAAGEGSAVVAVLPFETVGDANPTFTEGIHGDVLTRLSGLSGLDVISRSSVLRYRAEPDRPVGEIATELGVGWVLRGEVQQVGDQVQVNARLVDATRDRQVWAESFRRELTAANLFDIQREITRQIAAALESRLTPDERSPRGRPATDLEAYRLHAQGRGLLQTREEAPMRRAVDFFQRAIERDPEYAPAWAGLADALTYLETFGYEPPAGPLDARRAAERALELDPRLAEGHFALANLAHARRDNPEAIRRAERAIELRPSYSDAYNLLSWIHKQHGRVDAALEAGERAVDLDPLGSAPLSNLSLAHLARGDAGMAVREARRVRELHPDFTTGTFLEALALYHQGRYADARPLLEELDVAWAGAGPRATRALTDLALGDTAAARRALAGIDPADYPFSHALVRAGLGEVDAAMAAMARIDRWEYWPTFAVRHFFPDVLGPLRRDPAYPRILDRVDGSWGEGRRASGPTP